MSPATRDFSGTEGALELAGREGPVPLGYLRDGAELHLVARDRAARWPVDALRAGRARVRIGSERLEGSCRLRPPGPDRDRILEGFRAKYGEAAYRRWYAAPARVVTLDLRAVRPEPSPADRYYDWIASEFDNIAGEYDRHILGNRMNRLLRDRSVGLLTPTFRTARRLLEIGCGSGLETLAMLEAGHEVTAVDISRAMLDVTREKARRAGLSERLATIHASAREYARTSPAEGESERFDGGYSTYGAVNCESDLGPFRDAFAAAVRPGDPVVLGVYNRWCASELVAYGLTLRWSRALGRRSNPIRVGASRFCVDVFAYSPSEVRRGLAPEFRQRAITAVPLFLPPSDLTRYAELFGRDFDRLSRWDGWLARRGPFAGWGDHFLVTLERRAGASPGADATPGPLADASSRPSPPSAYEPGPVSGGDALGPRAHPA